MTESTELQTQTNFATANDFAKMLNGNYRTVVKILDQMLENGEVTENTIQKHKRVVKAYSYDNNTIKKMQKALLSIRHPQSNVAYKKNSVAYNNNANIDMTSTTNQMQQSSPNVTIYEVTKKNNDLENAINEYKLKVSDLEVAKTKVEADLYKAQADIRLIEDKNKTFESEVARLNQEHNQLQNTLKVKNRTITILSCIIGSIVLVACTVAVMLQLIKP